MPKRQPLFPHIPKSHKAATTYPAKMVSYLERSIDEELQAVRDYSQRATIARTAGDNETAQLFEHIAKEEENHVKEFGDRIAPLAERT